MPMVLYIGSGNTCSLMHFRISVQMLLTSSLLWTCSGYIDNWCNLYCSSSNVFHGGCFVKSITNVFSICGWFESVFFRTFSTSAWISLENISKIEAKRWGKFWWKYTRKTHRMFDQLRVKMTWPIPPNCKNALITKFIDSEPTKNSSRIFKRIQPSHFHPQLYRCSMREKNE